MQNNRTGLAMRVSVITLIGNIILSAGKFIVGLLAHSGALVSDAVHSASDAASTLIVMLGLRIAERDPDKNHPYGHERFECVCSSVLASMLIVTGIVIGKGAITQLTSNQPIPIPGTLALVFAVLSIIVKEAMFQYTNRAAKKINSPALKADAWHHRSDALSSIGSFIGILGARLGFPQMDAIASLVICLCILKVAYDILRESMNGMVDMACSAEEEKKIADAIRAVEGVQGLDLLRTRMFGSRVYVDVEIRADGSIPLRDAHQIAENVHHAVEGSLENVKHCMVHVNPSAE